MRTCTLEGCEREYRARGLCVHHYNKELHAGNFSEVQGTVEYRLAKVKFSMYCWEWQGSMNKGGYGTLKPSQKLGDWHLAHRWMFHYMGGVLDPDLMLDHLCRNRKCVNPMHLEQVTHEENMRRGVESRGCKKGHEFTEENTSWESQGKGKAKARRCKICRNESHQKRSGVKAFATK